MSNTRKQLKLSDVADVRTGFTFREKIEELPVGNAHIVQIKDVRHIRDITQSQQIYTNQLPLIDWKGKAHLLIDSECVLLPCRGEYIKAHFFAGNHKESKALPLIVSGQFLILTSNQHVLPEYLCWYLNQPIVQYELRQGGQGSKIPMLSVSMISKYEIEVPSLDIQQHIIALHRTWEQEKRLTQQLIKNREQMMQGIFQQLLKGQ